MIRSRKQKGFSLIELLAVIAIIAVMSTVIFKYLNGAKTLTKETRRQSDLDQVRTALALYYQDNGHYPTTNDGPNPPYPCAPGTSFLSGGCLEATLVTGKYMPSIPNDPEFNPNTQTPTYQYDNFCRVPGPVGSNPSRYRMWAAGQLNHRGRTIQPTADGVFWAQDTYFGYTPCDDPS